MCTEKESTVLMFWYQVKHCLLTKKKVVMANQRKKLWLLSGIGSGKKEALMAQRNPQLSFKHMEFGNIEGLLTRQVENLQVISYFNTKY